MPLPSQRKYDELLLANIEKYSKEIRLLYIQAIKEISKLSKSLNLNAGGELYLRNNSKVLKQINKVLTELNSNVKGITISGVNTSWDLANEKNDELTQYAFGENLEDLPPQFKNKYLSGNYEARRQFIARKIEGLSLSDRIWRNTQQFKKELELALEYGIGQGHAASTIARDIQDYLLNPNKLFRRVRDTKGILRLSKAAKAFNPGRGIYRSSYKNALRLARNETNFSYEQAQQEKRKQQDFVVGMEIRTSNNHNPEDDAGGISCIELAGLYPKDFNWTYKWHVNCKCYSLTVLKTREEMDKDSDLILSGQEPNTPSTNQVNGLPNNYTNYIKENDAKWRKYKTYPRTFESNTPPKILSKKDYLDILDNPSSRGTVRTDKFFNQVESEGNVPDLNKALEEIFDSVDEGNGYSKFIKSQPTKKVDIKDIVATQGTVVVSKIKKLLKDGVDIDKSATFIEFFKIGNNYYVQDGHHRIIAEIIEGKKTIKGKVWDVKNVRYVPDID